MSTSGAASGSERAALTNALKAAFIASNVAVVVFILNATAIQGASRLYENRRWVEHTRQVRQQIRDLYASLLEAESASRGYVITHDREFEDAYGAAEEATWAGLRALRALTRDNPAQQARCTELGALLRDKFAFLDSVMSTDARGSGELDRGRGLLRRTARALSDMDGDEMQLYFDRDAVMSKTMGTIYFCMMLILGRDVIALVMIAAVGLQAAYATRRRRRPRGAWEGVR